MKALKDYVMCRKLKYGGVTRIESPLVTPLTHARGRKTGRVKIDKKHCWTQAKLREATKLIYGFEGKFESMITVCMDLSLSGDFYKKSIAKLTRKLSTMCVKRGDDNVYIGLLEGAKGQQPHYHILTDLILDEKETENLVKLIQKWGFQNADIRDVYDDKGIREYLVKKKSWKDNMNVKPHRLPIKWADSGLQTRVVSKNFKSRLVSELVEVRVKDLQLKSRRQPFFQIQFGVSCDSEDKQLKELVSNELPKKCDDLKDLILISKVKVARPQFQRGVPAKGSSP